MKKLRVAIQSLLILAMLCGISAQIIGGYSGRVLICVAAVLLAPVLAVASGYTIGIKQDMRLVLLAMLSCILDGSLCGYIWLKHTPVSWVAFLLSLTCAVSLFVWEQRIKATHKLLGSSLSQ